MAPSGPVSFRSYRSAASGSRGTVFIADGQPGCFTVTGEFYRPSLVNAFRVGQILISLGLIASLVGALWIAAAAGGEADTPPMVWVLLLATLAMTIALLAWKAVLVSSAESATLSVRAVDIRRVRSSLNWAMLWWWILIGPFALIPLFAGRRRLMMEVPVVSDGRMAVMRLVLLEQRRGDAESVVARLRMSGAR